MIQNLDLGLTLKAERDFKEEEPFSAPRVNFADTEKSHHFVAPKTGVNSDHLHVS